jgi:hypothetical protein
MGDCSGFAPGPRPASWHWRPGAWAEAERPWPAGGSRGHGAGALLEFFEEFQFLAFQDFLVLFRQQGKILGQYFLGHLHGHFFGLVAAPDNDAENEAPGHADNHKHGQGQEAGQAELEAELVILFGGA